MGYWISFKIVICKDQSIINEILHLNSFRYESFELLNFFCSLKSIYGGKEQRNLFFFFFFCSFISKRQRSIVKWDFFFPPQWTEMQVGGFKFPPPPFLCHTRLLQDHPLDKLSLKFLHFGDQIELQFYSF
jgi:hypothetical protein